MRLTYANVNKKFLAFYGNRSKFIIAHKHTHTHTFTYKSVCVLKKFGFKPPLLAMFYTITKSKALLVFIKCS